MIPFKQKYINLDDAVAFKFISLLPVLVCYSQGLCIKVHLGDAAPPGPEDESFQPQIPKSTKVMNQPHSAQKTSNVPSHPQNHEQIYAKSHKKKSQVKVK